MKLETKLKRLVDRLPARQQTLDFLGDNLWQELSRDHQQGCRQAIADLLLLVLQEEPRNETNDNAKEKAEDE